MAIASTSYKWAPHIGPKWRGGQGEALGHLSLLRTRGTRKERGGGGYNTKGCHYHYYYYYYYYFYYYYHYDYYDYYYHCYDY